MQLRIHRIRKPICCTIKLRFDSFDKITSWYHSAAHIAWLFSCLDPPRKACSSFLTQVNVNLHRVHAQIEAAFLKGFFLLALHLTLIFGYVTIPNSIISSKRSYNANMESRVLHYPFISHNMGFDTGWLREKCLTECKAFIGASEHLVGGTSEKTYLLSDTHRG